ncbi:MAG: hypothetical protein QW203_06760 [Thermoplasmatales archaeon]
MAVRKMSLKRGKITYMNRAYAKAHPDEYEILRKRRERIRQIKARYRTRMALHHAKRLAKAGMHHVKRRIKEKAWNFFTSRNSSNANLNALKIKLMRGK